MDPRDRWLAARGRTTFALAALGAVFACNTVAALSDTVIHALRWPGQSAPLLGEFPEGVNTVAGDIEFWVILIPIAVFSLGALASRVHEAVLRRRVAPLSGPVTLPRTTRFVAEHTRPIIALYLVALAGALWHLWGPNYINFVLPWVIDETHDTFGVCAVILVVTLIPALVAVHRARRDMAQAGGCKEAGKAP